MRVLALTILLSLHGIAIGQSSQPDEVVQTSFIAVSAARDASGSSAQQGLAESPHHNLFNSDMFLANSEMEPHRSPVGSVTTGYIYTFTDSQTGHNRSLMGWSAVPELRVYKAIGLQTEFTGLYVRSVYPGENRFVVAAGPRYTFAPHTRFTPFIYAEGGEMRSTSQADHVSDWDPIVKGGFGFERKIAGGLAFQLIPGEYVGEQLDDHSWEHSYSARAGITFNLYR